jgi:hypothetical protein
MTWWGGKGDDATGPRLFVPAPRYGFKAEQGSGVLTHKSARGAARKHALEAHISGTIALQQGAEGKLW